MYVKNGGKLWRLKGSSESEKEFMDKPTSKKIKDYFEDGLTIREISKIIVCSTSTFQRMKNLI